MADDALPADDLDAALPSGRRTPTYQAEDGLPLPDDREFWSVRSYPWRDLRPGWSFFVPDRTLNQMRQACVQASVAHKPWGRLYRAARRTENGVDGVRVWRVR